MDNVRDDMMHYTAIGQCLILLIVANGAPILARDMFGTRGNWPLDGGLIFFDGRPLFGPTKTIRGVLAAVCASGLTALLGDLEVLDGVLFGFYAMLGDLGSSFIKRRLGLASSESVLGLDQGCEALCPVFILRTRFALQVFDLLFIVVAFFVIDVTVSRLLYRLHIRQRPL